MNILFNYNWDIREEWFKWCEEVDIEELLQERTGGVGGILHTLFHIVDVEYSWICILNGVPEFNEPFSDYQSLTKVRELSQKCHREVRTYIENCTPDMYQNKVDGIDFTVGEILHHMIAHEIHHIGQLSVWAREIGSKPVSANLIGKGYY
ncbi:DinB family protein [Fredinandcohnia humi]